MIMRVKTAGQVVFLAILVQKKQPRIVKFLIKNLILTLTTEIHLQQAMTRDMLLSKMKSRWRN
jgi:hypothetical protein